MDGWKFLKIQKTIDAYKITTNGPNDFKFGMVVLCMDIKLFVKKKFKKSFLFQNFIFQGGVDKRKRKFGTFGAHNFIMAAIFEIIFSPTSCY